MAIVQKNKTHVLEKNTSLEGGSILFGGLTVISPHTGSAKLKRPTPEVLSGHPERRHQVAGHAATRTSTESLLRYHSESVCLPGQAVDHLPPGESGRAGSDRGGSVPTFPSSSRNVSNVSEK